MRITVTSRLPEVGPVYLWQLSKDICYPHRPTHIFSAHFVLTRAHPGITFRTVTHPQIAPGQARLTSEFFEELLPEKKLQLVGMSILLILLSPGPGCHNTETRSVVCFTPGFERQNAQSTFGNLHLKLQKYIVASM